MARANLKKVNTSQRLLPQHQRTYPRGPESASLWPILSMMGFFPIKKNTIQNIMAKLPINTIGFNCDNSHKIYGQIL